MATLNIKNLPDDLYERLRQRAKQDRWSVAQEVTCLLTAALETSQSLSIMDLQGLGRELWEGVDAGAHVAAQRDAWD